MYRILMAATLSLTLSVLLVGCAAKPEKEVKVTTTADPFVTAQPQRMEDKPNTQIVEVTPPGKSILVQPKVTYSYKLGLMKEKTRTYELVKYPTGPLTVPVINGYVPRVFETVYPNGDKHVVYDYRDRTPYNQLHPAMKD